MSLEQKKTVLQSKSERQKYMDEQQSIKSQLAQERLKQKAPPSKVVIVGKATGKGIMKMLDEA